MIVSKSVTMSDPQSPQSPETVSEPDQEEKTGCLAWLRTNLLLILTIISVFVGIFAGFALRNYEIVKPEHKQTIRILAFPGVIFLQMMKLTVLPLIITSLITGLGQLGGKDTGKMMTITFAMFAVTTCLASYTGIALAMVIHPGEHVFTDVDLKSNVTTISTIDTLMDVFRNMFPENFIRAFTQSMQSQYEMDSFFNISTNTTIVTEELHVKYVEGTNALGIVAISVAVGICLSKMGASARIVIDLFLVIEKVITKLITLIMWVSPIGIVSFIIEQMVQVEDLMGVLTSVGWFIATVGTACFVHLFMTLPLIVFVLTRTNPYQTMLQQFPALATACALNSSGAALPLNFDCCENNQKIPRKVTRFVLPVGVSLDMNGTAAYEGAAAIFIAQLNGLQLTWAQIFVIGLMSMLASAACTVGPSADVVALIIVLTAIGIPLNALSLMLALDWIVGRFDAPVNVMCDAFAAKVVWHFMKNDEDDDSTAETVATTNEIMDA